MVSSGSLHIRLLHWQCAPQNIEFFLGDFKQPGFNSDVERISTEGVMRKIHQSIAVLVLALVGLVRCDQEQRAVRNTNPARVAEMQQTHRDLWLGHIMLVQHVVLYNAANNPAERDAAEKDVVANAKQIAIMVTPFYGEGKAEKFFALLAGHVAALKEYSEATVAVEFRYGKSDQNVFLRDNVGINNQQTLGFQVVYLF
jgi:hypothetical protein